MRLSLSHTHYWYEVGMLKVPASTHGSPAPVVNATGEAPPETAAQDVTRYKADL